jgi:hypothetical protein
MRSLIPVLVYGNLVAIAIALLVQAQPKPAPVPVPVDDQALRCSCGNR